MRWRNWNWLDLALLPLMMSVMRTCWLAPWLALLSYTFGVLPVFLTSSHGTEPAIGLAILGGVPLFSFWLARLLMSRLPQDDEMVLGSPGAGISFKARFWLGIGGLLLLLVILWWQYEQDHFALWNPAWVVELGQTLTHVEAPMVASAWLSLITLIFLWLRGLLDASRILGHDDVWAAMSSGLIALVVYLVVSRLFAVPVAADFSNAIVLFFAAGMTALAFSGLKITIGLDWALSGSRRSPKAPPLTRYWLISVAIIVLVLIGLGLLIGLLVAPEQVARFVALINSALNIVWRLLSYVLVAIAYVLFIVTYTILRIFEPLIQRLLAAMGGLADIMPPPNAQDMPQQEPIANTVATMPDAYRWVALLLFLLAVAFVFALVVRRLRAAAALESDEERESILSGDLLQDQLARLWQRLWGSRSAEEAWDPYLSLEGEVDSRRRIRALYQRLLSVSGRKGVTHQRGQTPREYQGALTSELRTLDDPLQQITEHYNHARYAPDPPAAERAAQAEAEWQSIETEFGEEGKGAGRDDRVTG